MKATDFPQRLRKPVLVVKSPDSTAEEIDMAAWLL